MRRMFSNHPVDYFSLSLSSQAAGGGTNQFVERYDPNRINHLPRFPLSIKQASEVSLIVGVSLALILTVSTKMYGKPKSSTTGVGGLYLAVFLDSFGTMCTLPFMGMLSAMLGCTGFETCLLGGVFAFTQFVGTIVLGILSDKLSTRCILLITLSVCSISLVFCGLTTLLPRQCFMSSMSGWHCEPYTLTGRFEGKRAPRSFNPAYLGLLGARALAGFFASTVSVIETVISKMSTDEERTGNVAQVMAYFGLGMVAGPIVSGILYDFGFAFLNLVSGAITMVNVFYVYWTLTIPSRLPNSIPTAHGVVASKQGSNRKSSNAHAHPECNLPRISSRRPSYLNMDIGCDLPKIARQAKRREAFAMSDAETARLVAEIKELPMVAECSEEEEEDDIDSPMKSAVKVLYFIPFTSVLLFGTFLATATTTLAMTIFPLFCSQVYQWGGVQLGVNLTLCGIAMTLALAVLAGPISKKLGETLSIILGSILRAMLCIVFVSIRHPLVPWFAGPLALCTGCMIDAPLQSLISRYSPSNSIGTLMGFMQALRSLGEAVAPPVVGFLVDIDIDYPLYVSAGVACCCALVFLPYLKRTNGLPRTGI